MEKTVTLPNEIIFEAVEERMARGEATVIPFAGKSMEPTLRDGRVKIRLAPVGEGRMPRRGDIVLFRMGGRHILHRVVRREGTHYTMRGDACATCEKVESCDVVAKLDSVIYPNGRCTSCQSARWRLRSALILTAKGVRRGLSYTIGRRRRRVLSPLYIVALLLLMWAPLAGLGIPLNNFVLGIRLDHLIHASVYLPAAWFIAHWWSDRSRPSLITALLLAMTTEGVQYLLPYRGFDINDLAANLMGVTAGWLTVRRKLKTDK
ncbi:MAG: VanZ family protein [Bacteroidales bacterium]|nr:VanZ family protein [Bacteroidales bacterium]